MDEILNKIEKYNFWNNNLPETGYLRTDYTDKILQYSESRLVKVIVGQRRAGKSYLLRQIASCLIKNGVNAGNILYLNKEFTEFDRIDNYQHLESLFSLYKQKMKPEGKIYLLLDEIQNIRGWEHFVNSHSQDFTEKCDIFITGSNSKMLSGELATLLSGRYVSFEVFPFDFEEFVGITQKQASRQSFLDYMQSGGLPELFVLPNEETKRNYVSAVKDTVLLRDIIQRRNIEDAVLLDDIFAYLINNISNLFSANNIVNYIKSSRKTSYNTVSNYISFIEDTFLIHKTERFDIRRKEIMSGTCKYYANDMSYKNYLYKGFAGGIGYLLENVVYLQLRQLGFDVYTGVLRNKEIDFVAMKEDRKIYVQSSYLLLDEQTIAREYEPLLSVTDHYEKYVVSLDEVALASNNGVKHVQAWDLKNVIMK